MNTIQLYGHIGNVEYQTGNYDTGWLKISVGENRRVKRGDSWEDETQWHRCVLSGARADSLKDKLTKGCGVVVFGEVIYREKDEKRYTNIRIRDLQVTKWAEDKKESKKSSEGGFDFDDDVPF